MRKRSDRQIRERERSGKKEKDQTDTQKRYQRRIYSLFFA